MCHSNWPPFDCCYSEYTHSALRSVHRLYFESYHHIRLYHGMYPLFLCTSVGLVLTPNNYVKKFRQLGLLAVGRWFPAGPPVSSTRQLISSSSFHRLDMTLAVAEALYPSTPKTPQRGSDPIRGYFLTEMTEEALNEAANIIQESCW